jgi:hypothetical protein
MKQQGSDVLIIKPNWISMMNKSSQNDYMCLKSGLMQSW